jgi:hypothetical protein
MIKTQEEPSDFLRAVYSSRSIYTGSSDQMQAGNTNPDAAGVHAYADDETSLL